MVKTLKAHRKRVGLTQTEIASELGLTQAVVSNWERGSAEVPERYIAKLAGLLDCNEDDLRAWQTSPQMITKQPESWRDHVVAESDLSPYAMLVLMALPVFADAKTGIVSCTFEDLQRSTRLEALFDQAFAEAMESGYIRRIGSAEYTFELTYPKQ